MHHRQRDRDGIERLRPIAEIQFLDFIHSAMDQIMSEAARIRYRSNNDFSCPLVIRVPFGGGVHGALYHSQSIEAMFVHTPGLKVLAPAFPADAAGLLRAAIRGDDPVLFLEHKKMYRSIKGPVPAGDFEVPIGKARVVQEGTDATIVTYGMMVHESLKAVRPWRETGVSDRDHRSPFAQTTRRDYLISRRRRPARCWSSPRRTDVFVASEVAAMIGEEAFAYLDAPVMRSPLRTSRPCHSVLRLSTHSWLTPRKIGGLRCRG